jgi:hypothetical protein
MPHRFFENKHSLEILKARLEEELMDISNTEDFYTVKERIDEVNRALGKQPRPKRQGFSCVQTTLY